MAEAAYFDQWAMYCSCWTVGEDACWPLNEGGWEVFGGKILPQVKRFFLLGFWYAAVCHHSLNSSSDIV